VDQHGLREKLRLNTTVASAVFDEHNNLWRLTAAGDQQITADMS
jgi:cation diffusion facilitator CzcD-associated flavoprotein CzcO